mmetsp:Transcript_170575/g.547131  ORF Transcript_170575/g.547131 Transcript_170575/m.547131 type:complete len:260 (-) Transcript_170575:399-1178(-)
MLRIAGVPVLQVLGPPVLDARIGLRHLHPVHAGRSARGGLVHRHAREVGELLGEAVPDLVVVEEPVQPLQRLRLLRHQVPQWVPAAAAAAVLRRASRQACKERRVRQLGGLGRPLPLDDGGAARPRGTEIALGLPGAVDAVACHQRHWRRRRGLRAIAEQPLLVVVRTDPHDIENFILRLLLLLRIHGRRGPLVAPGVRLDQGLDDRDPCARSNSAGPRRGCGGRRRSACERAASGVGRRRRGQAKAHGACGCGRRRRS